MNEPERIRNKLRTLRDLASQLDKMLVCDQRTREYLLRPISNALDDVETSLLPHGLKASNPRDASMWFYHATFMLEEAQRGLQHVQALVEKFGPSIEAVGW